MSDLMIEIKVYTLHRKLVGHFYIKPHQLIQDNKLGKFEWYCGRAGLAKSVEATKRRIRRRQWVRIVDPRGEEFKWSVTDLLKKIKEEA